MSTVVGLNARSEKCPGLEWRERGGVDTPIWIAPKRAVKAGFTPKSVTLPVSLSTVELAAQCRRLQAEVLEFLAGGSYDASAAVYDGSIKSAVDIFQTHKLSPFILKNRLGWKTKRNMRDDLATIVAEIGGRQLHVLKSEDAQDWYDIFKAPVMKVQVGTPLSRVGVERLTQARRFITLIRTMLRFCAMVDVNPDLTVQAKRLTDKYYGALSIVRCETPIPRVSEVSYDMVEALCDLARSNGYYSVALAVAVQFETGLRQLDAIGEWEPQGAAMCPNPTLARTGRQRSNKKRDYIWKYGIVWGANIDKDLILTKLTSKSKFKKMAKFNLRKCPMVMKELDFVPFDRRIGPLIIQEGGMTAGMPWSREYFSSVCNKLINELVLTDKRFVGVTNMDMRSAAITEAFDGVDEDSTAAANVQKLYGQHATAKQTAHYNRATLEKSEAMSDRRVATREARRLADGIGAGRVVG